LPGITSAEASGARVIAVPHIVPIPAASGRSRVSSLVELTLRDLARICAGEVIDRFGTTT
jgi:beta-phosphoglucomutase-like phosphatase (HAD superfamily)